MTVNIKKGAESSKEQLERVANAVRSVELTEFSSWNDLDILSSRTKLEQIEVLEDSTRISDEKFSGVLNFYVILEYGQGEDAFTTSEAFPGTFNGHFDERRKPIIDDIIVDTSSFYL